MAIVPLIKVTLCGRWAEKDAVLGGNAAELFGLGG